MTLTYWIAGVMPWVHRSELSPGGWDWQESSLQSQPPLGPGLGKWSISFYCMWRKAICKSLSTNVRCGQALLRLDFHISPTSLISAPLSALTIQTPGKWQFSLICGPSEPPSGPWNEFISPQWDANDWCYNNIAACHHQLCIWKGRKCIVLSLSQYCLLLQRMMTSTQMHEKVQQHKHILYWVHLHWIYKDFHFAIVMATLYLFHSFPLI